METHRQGHDQAGGGIEKAETKDIVLDKFCQRKKDDLENVGGDVLAVKFLGSNIGVEIYFF